MPLEMVLLGGGLSHCVAIKVIHDLLLQSCPNVRVTLISSWDFTYYSAMLPGVLCGKYREEDTRIDLRPLAFACNSEFVVGTAVRLDPAHHRVHLQDGQSIHYDILSVNIGSRTLGTASVPGVEQWAILTRPLNVFTAKLALIESKLQTQTDPIRILVVGSGISGIELLSSLKIRFSRQFSREVTAILVDKTPAAVNHTIYQRVIERNLQRSGIEVRHNCAVKQMCGPGDLELADGSHLLGDCVIWAAGLEPQPVITGLDTCPRGYIKVTSTLQVPNHDDIFACGDCITMQGMPSGFPPKTGVHALREGPILALNAIACVKAKLFDMPVSLLLYDPEPNLLQLVNFGDIGGLLTKFGMTFSGKWASALKDYHDRQLMDRFSPRTLLGEEGYQHYLEVKSASTARSQVYSHRDTSRDSEWRQFVYEMELRLATIEEDVRNLSASEAFRLLWEASDLATENSQVDFVRQLHVLTRAQLDLEFRSELVRHYQAEVANLVL